MDSHEKHKEAQRGIHLSFLFLCLFVFFVAPLGLAAGRASRNSLAEYAARNYHGTRQAKLRISSRGVGGTFTHGISISIALRLGRDPCPRRLDGE
jgi:hypothetical protein